MRRLPLILLSLLIAAAVIVAAAYYRYTHPLVVAIPTTAATHQTTAPVTAPVVKRKPLPGPTTQLLDIVRAIDPKYPTTQRLDSALDLRYAARVVLSDPVYLDTQGNTWITRADAPSSFNFLKASQSETATQVTRDAVVFVLWTASDNGKWLPHLVVKNPSGAGYQLVDYDGRRNLADPYHFDWSRALILAGRAGEPPHIVVPTATGACAFTFEQNSDAIAQSHHQLIHPKSKDAGDRAVQLVMDVSGVIAYVTNAAGTKGAKGVARFAPTKPQAGSGYKWANLTGWPDHLLHLVPLLDGSVLQIVSDDAEEKDKVLFSLNSLAPVAIDKKKVLQLVDQLSASDPEKREDAFKQLTTYGPGISPLLEEQIDFQPVEAQIRIRQLLKNKVEPSLSSMTLNDGRMRVVNRLPDGGVIFFAEGGVAIPRPDDTPTYVTPAWLCIRPGRAVELLPPALVADLKPDKQKIIAWGLNDFVVQDPVLGPQWYIGNRLEPMMRKRHRQFTQFAGIDNGGRWIFRAPMSAAGSSVPSTTARTPATSELASLIRTQDITNEVLKIATTQPSTQGLLKPAPATTATTTAAAERSRTRTQQLTLIIDPRLPDTTPRLPGWQLPASSGKVGWDKNNWPVIYMDVKPDPVPWALEESNWRVIDEKKEKVYTDPAEIPKATPATHPAAATHAATTSPATTHAASTATTTTQQAAPLITGEPLLLAPDGTRYYDGQQYLKMQKADGTLVSWLLPNSAVGEGKPTLLQNKDGLLFLFNAAGRIVRIRPTPNGDEPFTVDGVFTRTVPTDANPQRIWIDPADRICIAHSGNTITIFFTIGRIPPAISEKMRPEDFPPEEE
jgi:hypothetical protein